eukprot:6404556-Alexandrium_andersonii.AAC.1
MLQEKFTDLWKEAHATSTKASSAQAQFKKVQGVLLGLKNSGSVDAALDTTRTLFDELEMLEALAATGDFQLQVLEALISGTPMSMDGLAAVRHTSHNALVVLFQNNPDAAKKVELRERDLHHLN